MAANKIPAPQTIFGSAPVGSTPAFQTPEKMKHVADILKKHNITRIDSAARYGMGNSESTLGSSGLSKDFAIDTKVMYTGPNNASLSAEKIRASVDTSLQRLGTEKVHVLYCHAMDKYTPIDETAREMHKQYEQGHFEHLGVSNFSVEALSSWLSLSEQNGWVKPSWYEGHYNLLSRGDEKYLFPLMRKHNMHYAAFSPHAGGFLLGNLRPDKKVTGSRISGDTPGAKMYRSWYDTPAMHEAVDKLRGICGEASGSAQDGAVLRWLFYHSALTAGDGVIIGASRVEQISSSAEKIALGPLDPEVAKAMSDLWEGVREDGEKIVQFG